VSSFQSITIYGPLGKDPEIRSTTGGAPRSICTLVIPTETHWEKDGQKQSKTEWHRVILWGKTAENAHHRLRKGDYVFVVGRVETRKWEDKSGAARYSTEIVAERIEYNVRPKEAAAAAPASPAVADPWGNEEPF